MSKKELTAEGLRDTLDDIDKQLEKATLKYESLKKYIDAIKKALGKFEDEPGTYENLREALEDLGQQFEKADKKYNVLKNRSNAVNEALLHFEDSAA